MNRMLLLGALGFTVAPATATLGENWYDRAFYLLHEDHHTSGSAEVGRDADPAETARLINLSRPDMIQIHAKGNPGWTTYPTQIGHAPPLLKRDVLAVWRRIADRHGYPFSVYYNLGRDGELMKRRPEWNRSDAAGNEVDRALCYHSGVAEAYLWPMIDEVMHAYRPQGWWFDGSCFTVRLCYCDRCRSRFAEETGGEPPTEPADKAWTAYHEMQRQIYRECVRDTAKRIHAIDAECLVAVNWAYSLRMPEKPVAGIAYLTGDIGNRVEGLSAEAHWYDGTGWPFDLMTQLNTRYPQPLEGAAMTRPTFGPKPPEQIQQEMAVVVANGGRFHVWDSPTPESGLTPARHKFLAEHVAPWLSVRKPWCLGSTRVPDISLLNSSAAHYAVTDASGPVCFNRRNNRIEGAADLLPRLHLNYEMVGDWRLYDQDVDSRVLVVEHAKRLTQRDLDALVAFVRRGGKLLLSAMGIHHGRGKPLHEVFGLTDFVGPKSSEALAVRVNDASFSFEHHLFRCNLDTAESLVNVEDASGDVHPLLTRNQFGDGQAYYFAAPMLTAHGSSAIPVDLLREVFRIVVPPDSRHVTVEAPESVEIVLRKQGSSLVLHLVNMAAGRRETTVAGGRRYVTIRDLPQVPACGVSIRVPEKPARVLLQPQGKPLAEWQYENGRLEAEVPGFPVHQMVVVEWDDRR